jgi:hypothetical protein
MVHGDFMQTHVPWKQEKFTTLLCPAMASRQRKNSNRNRVNWKYPKDSRT